MQSGSAGIDASQTKKVWLVGGREGSHLCKQPGALVLGGAALCFPRGLPGRQLRA